MTIRNKLTEFLEKFSGLQRSAINALILKITAAGCGFGMQIFLARTLGADQYGLFSYAWVLIDSATILLTLGLAEASVRFIAEYRDTKKPDLVWGFVYSSFIIVFLTSLLFSLSTLYIYVNYNNLFMGVSHNYIILILICLPVFSLQYLIEGYALSFSWAGQAQLFLYMMRPILIVLIVGLLALLSFPVDAEFVLTATLIAALITIVFQLIAFFRRASRIIPIEKGVLKLKHWLGTSFPMFLSGAFQVILSSADVLILGMFVPPREVALYFAATRLSSQVYSIFYAVDSVAAQRMASFFATKKHDEFLDMLHTATRWTFGATLIAAAGILSAGWFILWLFGLEFTQAYPLIPILLLGMLAQASTGGAESALKMTGYERQEFFVKAISIFVNIGLNFSLIPYYGIYGAATATAISLIIYSIVVEVLVRKHLGTTSFIATLPAKQSS